MKFTKKTPMSHHKSPHHTSHQDSALCKSQIENLSEQDWRARLGDDAYHILRQKGTERPFSGIYTDHTAHGVYRCRGCHTALFDSKHKYHSGCGWPSFDTAIADAIDEHLDTSHGMRRIEVVCSNCQGHLGHVFTDGPQHTTGMRYCINSLALDFTAKI